jgi:hypothetical protein
VVNKILTGAGFVSGKTYIETRFLKPPKSTYAIYNDTKTVRGPDYINAITEHEVNIELYEYAPDPASEAAIEAQLDAYGQPYIKQNRYWINEAQLFQVIYEFNYLTKRGDFYYGST